MVYQGTIHNGVVVFENGVQLPEGTPGARGTDQGGATALEAITKR